MVLCVTLAHANAAVPLIARASPFLFFSLVPIILIEAVILHYFLRGSWKNALGASVAANIISALVGWIPLGFAELFTRFGRPGMIAMEERALNLWFSALQDEWESLGLAMLLAFAISVGIEMILIRRRYKDQPQPRVRLSVLAANGTTYLLICLCWLGWFWTFKANYSSMMKSARSFSRRPQKEVQPLGATALPRLIERANKFKWTPGWGKGGWRRVREHQRIASYIGKIRDPLAVSGLMALLDHPSPYMRSNAARALAAMEVTAAEPKIEALARDPDADVRTEVLRQLLAERPDKYLPDLFSTMASTNTMIRNQAIRLTAELKFKEAVPALEGMLTHPSDLTRYAASRALKEITKKDYDYAKTQRTKDQELLHQEWDLIKQGRHREAEELSKARNVETEDERREALEKLRERGLLVEPTKGK